VQYASSFCQAGFEHESGTDVTFLYITQNFRHGFNVTSRMNDDFDKK